MTQYNKICALDDPFTPTEALYNDYLNTLKPEIVIMRQEKLIDNFLLKYNLRNKCKTLYEQILEKQRLASLTNRYVNIICGIYNIDDEI